MLRSGKVSPSLKWCVLVLNFIVTITGATILACSLRLLFDPDFSHLLFQNGIYFGGQILAGAGAIMFIAGIIGCVAVLIEHPCLLSTFLAFLVVFVAAEIAGGVMAYNYRPELHKTVEFNLLWAVERFYGTDVANTTILNRIQEGWECCGSHSYSSWSNSVYGNFGRNTPREAVPNNVYRIPLSCCVDQASDACKAVHFSGINSETKNLKGVIYTEGCSPILADAINTYSLYLFGLGSGIVLLQIIALVLTAILIYAVKSNGARLVSKKAYYASSAASQSILAADQHSESHKSSPSFAGSRSPSLDLAPAKPYGQDQVSSLV